MGMSAGNSPVVRHKPLYSVDTNVGLLTSRSGATIHPTHATECHSSCNESHEDLNSLPAAHHPLVNVVTYAVPCVRHYCSLPQLPMELRSCNKALLPLYMFLEHDLSFHLFITLRVYSPFVVPICVYTISSESRCSGHGAVSGHNCCCL